MKKLLPFCLLVAIFGANADTYSTVNLSNSNTLAPSGSTTISATRPVSDSGETTYAYLSCFIMRENDSPIRLHISSKNNQPHEFFMSWDIYKFPSVVTIDDENHTLTYEFDDDETDISIDIENLDPMGTVSLDCDSVAESS